MKKPNGQQDHSPSSLVEVLNLNPFYHNRRVREGVQIKSIFLGNSPKQRTPPTHPYGLGLT